VAYFAKIFKIVATPCGDFGGRFGAKQENGREGKMRVRIGCESIGVAMGLSTHD